MRWGRKKKTGSGECVSVLIYTHTKNTHHHPHTTQDLVTLFSSAPSSLLTTASKLAELVTLLPFRLLPHAALLGTHLLRLHAPERVLRPLGIVAPVEGVSE